MADGCSRGGGVSESSTLVPDTMTSLREAGAVEFARRGLPTTRDEEWRFTPLGDLAKWRAFESAEPGENPTIESLAPHLFGTGLPRLVLVDGHYVPELSSSLAMLPADVVVMPLGEAIAEGHPVATAELGRWAGPDQTAFTALNASLFTDGLFLHVPKGVAVTTPIQLLSVTTAAAGGKVVAPRMLIVLGESASATVVESYASAGDAASFTNAVVEVHLGANARLDHTRVAREHHGAWHIGFTHVDQEQDSHYRSFALAMGGRLCRHNLHTRHLGERVETLLYGLYLTTGDQLADTHSAIFHDRPNCNSWEVYKGVLGGRSRGVFNGKVLVDRLAQKTDAKQTNRNLLLSDQARVDTKPQLEIFADDVKCTHGATIGQLNEQQRYYLQSRGIGGKQAEQLLTWAFAAEVVAEIADRTVRQVMESVVHTKLGEMTA